VARLLRGCIHTFVTQLTRVRAEAWLRVLLSVLRVHLPLVEAHRNIYVNTLTPATHTPTHTRGLHRLVGVRDVIPVLHLPKLALGRVAFVVHFFEIVAVVSFATLVVVRFLNVFRNGLLLVSSIGRRVDDCRLILFHV